MVGNSHYSLPPYVGVTGIQHLDEVNALLPVAREMGFCLETSHNLMLGALVSPTFLVGEAPIHTDKPWRHVHSLVDLVEMFQIVEQSGAISMLHFELHKQWPGTSGDMKSVINLLKVLHSEGCHPAVQLNGVILPDEVKSIHQETGAAIVIQLRDSFTAQPEESVLAYFSQISESISMVLMDPSAGGGHLLDLAPALRWHQILKRHFPGVFSFGFAGGLGGSRPSDLHKTESLVSRLVTEVGGQLFSLDAETGVRESTAQGDALSVPLVRDYLEAVKKGLAAA